MFSFTLEHIFPNTYRRDNPYCPSSHPADTRPRKRNDGASLCAVGPELSSTQPTEPLVLALKQPDPPWAGWMYASIIPSVSITKNVF